MAKQVIWSDRAIDDLLKIFEYWNYRNKSTSYSKKLNELFTKAIALIANYSSIGRPSQIENIRIKIVKDYLIIYEDTPELIIILTIWDSRRNLEDLERIIKK
jgi:addiction module RelE/StbE family toxin